MAFPSQPKLPLHHKSCHGGEASRGRGGPGLRALPSTARAAWRRGALRSSDEPSPKSSVFSHSEASPVPHRIKQAVPAERAVRGCAEQRGGQPGSPRSVSMGYAENAELCLGCGHQCAYRSVILVSVASQ